jgi:hypothetical protein
MKKIIYLLIAFMVVSFFSPSSLNAKPFFIKFKLGFFAKWSITFNGDCEDGKGICLALGNNSNPNGDPSYLGYDDETNDFQIKMSKQSLNAKYLQDGTLSIGEDSPVDPKLIENFPNFRNNGKNVIIKKGTYKVVDNGEFYLLNLDYYIQ